MSRPDLPGGENLSIVFDEEVAAQMENDPKMKAAIRSFCASMRQAAESVKEGRYETMDDALEAITGTRPIFIGRVVANDNDD